MEDIPLIEEVCKALMGYCQTSFISSKILLKKKYIYFAFLKLSFFLPYD